VYNGNGIGMNGVNFLQNSGEKSKSPKKRKGTYVIRGSRTLTDERDQISNIINPPVVEN
jgi:hypothetical protein